ncbi:MAG: glycogen/starch synthase [Treponemataceae bacterium]|nr:glycogen/starch synthase [Treponemataceae bacterium]
MAEKVSLWQISREYAGIAEAGGVKNVVCSLSENLLKNGFDVTLFIPLYGCTSLSSVQDLEIVPGADTSFEVLGRQYRVSFGIARSNGVRIVFVISSLFTEKMGVYTYTALEENLVGFHKRGTGHVDAISMEMVFQQAVLAYGIKTGECPKIVHCHDATTALVPVFARCFDEYSSFFASSKFVVTIHNGGPAYHHEIASIDEAEKITGLDREVLEKGRNGSCIEPYLLASDYAFMTTVSPWYAEELSDPENPNTDGLSKAFYERGTKIAGITNGIDFGRYNPENPKKSLIPMAYNPRKQDFAGKLAARSEFLDYFAVARKTGAELEPLLGNSISGIVQYGTLDPAPNSVFFSYHGRIAEQKGLDVLIESIGPVLEKMPHARFVIIGQGYDKLEKRLVELTARFEGKVLFLHGYDRFMARLCVAVSDFIVLPSFFEPCGLEDFIASCFGTIPVAHATGGLQKIQDGKTGFLYGENTPDVLADCLARTAEDFGAEGDKYREIAQKACQTVHDKYSWNNVTKKEYIPLFMKLLEEE